MFENLQETKSMIRPSIKSILWYSKILWRTLSLRATERLGITPKPRWINFQVTNKCNLLCLMCNVGREYLRNPNIAKDELRPDELEMIFARDFNMLKRVSFIQITGGEPFMREDLVDVVATISKFLPRCYIWIATNGTLPAKIKSDVTRITAIHKRVGVGVSLDGDEQIHDKIRGVKGTYAKALQTIKALLDIREGHPWLDVSVSMTITPLNYHLIEFVHKLSKRYNVGFSFRPVNISEIYYRNLQGGTLWKKPLDVNKAKKLFEHIAQIIVTEHGLASFPHLYYLWGAFRFMTEHNLQRDYDCFAASSSFYLDAKGNVFPCVFLNEKIGNLREQTLREMWTSKRAKFVREFIRRRKCNCWVECETYRSIEENFDKLIAFLVRLMT